MGRMSDLHIEKMNEDRFGNDPIKQRELQEQYESYCEGINHKTTVYSEDSDRMPTRVDLRLYKAISSVNEGKQSSLIGNDGSGLVIDTPFITLEYLFNATR